MSDERSVAIGDRRQIFSVAVRHAPLVPFVMAAMEAVLLALIVLSPWGYGANHPSFEFVLDAGIAVLLLLWAARMLLEWQITWKNSAVALCLASLFLLGIWQETPLSRSTLAWLSPGTARCYKHFLPEQPETLPDDTAASAEASHPGSTLSLYPGATQRESLRLLSVFLVFVVVYNNLASKESLIRLSWTTLLNGALLSLFALFQFFAAPPYTVYWTYPSRATPFGPFICHNHFPDYVNMCIGLGIGLLLSRGSRGHSSLSGEQNDSLVQMLRNPRTLWICSALGLMLTAVAFSQSRGGVLALAGAALLCGILGRLRLGRSFRLGPILVVGVVVVGLFAWFGIGLVKARLATLGTGEAFENRLPMWLRSLPIVPEFPIWGTGYGTFGYVEIMKRPDVPSPQEELVFWVDHAHNDYLEMLVEGGVVGLGLVLIALVAVYRRGFRALSANRGSRRAGLALGTLFAFTAIALHSFGDFGMHIPAIALLATVVCAHLCALGESRPHKTRSVNRDDDPTLVPASASVSAEDDSDGDVYRFRLGGIAPIFGAIVALGFGLLICADTWKAHRIERLRSAALRAGDAEVDQVRTRIACLSEAVSLDPENAQLHSELAFAHEQLGKLLAGNPTNLLQWAKFFTSGNRRAVDEQGLLALQEHVRARNACPLLCEAQWGIAPFARRLERGDSAEIYLRRAKDLCPGRVFMRYMCGLREQTLMRFEDAWETWKHCLELSDRYLPEILIQTAGVADSNQLVEKVLPDNAELLLKAALLLYPDFGSLQRRRPFLEKALRVLESKQEVSDPHELLLKARIYKALDKPDKAIEYYTESLEQDGSQVPIRYEFAEYLREMHKLEEAQHQLKVMLAQEPKSSKAKELLDAVVQERLQAKDLERKRQQEDRLRSRRR